MEQCDNSSWLTMHLKTCLRRVVLLLNVALWFSVLYYFIHHDEIAAFLSYVFVTSTILTVKYYSWDVISNEFVAYYIDCSSKTLILGGLFLVLLPQFWNTAFYSICLGIVIQTMNCEILDRARNEILLLHMKVADQVAETDSTEKLKLLNLQNEAHEMQITENKMKDLNRGKTNDLLIENTRETLNMEVKQREENIQKEIQGFHNKLNKCHPDVSETTSDYEGMAISYNKENNIGVPEESDKNENSLHDHNSQRQTVSMEAVESTLKRMEYFTQSNVSNYGETEEIQNTDNLCTPQIQLLNLQEMQLSEYSELESKFELNENNIERELKRNEAESVNFSVKYLHFNENLKGVSKDNTKQFDTADKSMETITESETEVKNEFYQKQVNTCYANSDDSENFNKNDFIISYSEKTLLQTKKSEGKCEIDGKPVQLRLLIKGNNSLLLNNDSTTLDTTLQHVENTVKVNNQEVDTELQRENTSGNDGSSNSEPKYESMNCTSVKTVRIQPEKEMSAYSIKCIPENFNDESINLIACLQDKERIGEGCSMDFDTNRENNSVNETNLESDCFETSKNLNSEVEYSNMNCTSLKTTNIQSENDISQKKLVPQQVIDGNLETVLVKNDKVLLETEYSFKRKCLSNSSKILCNPELNESTDVEEINYTNKFVKKSSGDEGTTHFSNVSNVDDVVNRIDLGFIYALGFNVPRAEDKF